VSGGLDYWRARLAPLAADGYLSGLVDTETVLLRNEATGYEVLLPRPSAGWVAASVLHQRSMTLTIRRP
jgi:hypothetical protein